MIERLIDEIVKKDAPIVVGLDPMLNFVPKFLLQEATEKHGKTIDAVCDAIFEYNKTLIDSVYDLVPAVKPQIAMYEQFGIPGLIVYEKTIKYAASKGLIVIADVKRGDIGSTSSAYATAHLGKIDIFGEQYTPFGADMATVNPYLGTDGIKPFLDVCNTFDKGIFVLVKTSNSSSGEFQDKEIAGEPLYALVAKRVKEWGEMTETHDYSNVGAVVGATYPEMGKVLRKMMPKTYILVPGYGAQGGRGKDLKVFFNPDGLGAIINSSRGIIAAYKQEEYKNYGEKNFGEAARQAVINMRKDIKESI